ncbi:ADP-ribose pyrophosphatase YjhB (NUDIX family) [Actinocorallia herbida]|uniref:ADP-ribose pyrophosphatase YjhB (NUDIX family) n=1 Tax=Actinocorallia herbida TaxID=58109 RepID=A0A3N1D6A6_9ACTN|nr:NUDIX hydrolase [Actinocorallia herbida]ROO89067.1 ADP-ribose pyrophosphatase YjhB (NUDIX family) [Actinocorallia herbida]
MSTDWGAGRSRPFVAAGVLFFDEWDRVLLVVPTYKDDLDIPGGYVEGGETPWEAAVREVREELGISPPIGRLLVTDWAPDDVEGDKVLYVFDGGRIGADLISEIRLDPGEIAAIAFHPLSEVPTLTIARLARRVQQAGVARATGGTLYLEHGRPFEPRR